MNGVRADIAFRVDASAHIGSGHVYRCLRLAAEFRARGLESLFLYRPLDTYAAELIARHEFASQPLPRAGAASSPGGAGAPAWAIADEVADAEACLPFLGAAGARVLVIDHYGIGASWHERVRPAVDRIVAIDDLADRVLGCDIVLNQGLIGTGRETYDALVPPAARCLLGPRYALLDAAFVPARAFRGPRRGPVARVLVFYGGGDVSAPTLSALRVLSRPALRHLAVDVVLGPSCAERAALDALVAAHGRAQVHEMSPSLLPLLMEADLTLGAAGSTSWERCCVGVPSVLTLLADNQRPIAAGLAAEGAAWVVSPFPLRKTDVGAYEDELARAVDSACRAHGDFAEGARRAWGLVDGLGAARVAEAIVPSPADDIAAVSVGADAHGMSWRLMTKRGVDLGGCAVALQGATGRFTLALESEWEPEGLVRQAVNRGARAFWDCHPGVPLVADGTRGTTAAAPGAPIARPSGARAVAVLSDRDSWINEYIADRVTEWLLEGRQVHWVHRPQDLSTGDVLVMLGCSQLVSAAARARHTHNLVVHESALPRGKGWSPMTWQVVEGAREIVVTLFEAADRVDAGPIYAQGVMRLDGTEFVDELRRLQAEASLLMCTGFIEGFPRSAAAARSQEGPESFYPRRTKDDSRLDVDKTLAESFDLLRVVDNARYPAFFEHRGVRVEVRVMKVQANARDARKGM